MSENNSAIQTTNQLNIEEKPQVQAQEDTPKEQPEKQKEDKKQEKKKVDHVKNVNVKQCVFMIIGTILGMLILLVPATFGDKLTFFFQHIPFLSGINKFDLTSTALMMQGLAGLLGLTEQITSLLSTIFSFTPFVYFGILVFDFIFSLLLIIIRSEKLRLICKIISIILSIVMFFICILYLIYIIGFLGLIIKGILPFDQISSSINSSGILLALAFVFFSFIFFIKQIKWFAKLY